MRVLFVEDMFDDCLRTLLEKARCPFKVNYITISPLSLSNIPYQATIGALRALRPQLGVQDGQASMEEAQEVARELTGSSSSPALAVSEARDDKGSIMTKAKVSIVARLIKVLSYRLMNNTHTFSLLEKC